MRHMMKMITAAVFAATAVAAPALADEVRLGIAKHDLSDTESGFDIQAQYVFGKEPDAAGYWTIRPYLVVATNTDGYINFGGAGLQPEYAISENWLAEFQFGVVAHDGRIDLPPPNMPVERQFVLDTERTYGCEALFHLSPSLRRNVTDNLSVAFYWEHLSHGQIICSGKNEGLDNYGLRLGYRF
ncbi:MAG: acyloxyacyl hydrolase [Pseudomonadota bacterium]